MGCVLPRPPGGGCMAPDSNSSKYHGGAGRDHPHTQKPMSVQLLSTKRNPIASAAPTSPTHDGSAPHDGKHRSMWRTGRMFHVFEGCFNSLSGIQESTAFEGVPVPVPAFGGVELLELQSIPHAAASEAPKPAPPRRSPLPPGAATGSGSGWSPPPSLVARRTPGAATCASPVLKRVLIRSGLRFTAGVSSTCHTGGVSILLACERLVWDGLALLDQDHSQVGGFWKLV